MSFVYTQKITPIIIKLLEEGQYSIRQIAYMCNVSISFVRKVINNYDGFYAKKAQLNPFLLISLTIVLSYIVGLLQKYMLQ